MLRYTPAPASLYKRHRKLLTKQLEPGALAIVHSNDVMPTNADGTLGFKQNADLLWLSGIDQEETILLLFPDAPDPAHREILFVRETTPHLVIWEGHKLTKEQATAASGIDNVQWTSAFPGLLQTLMTQASSIWMTTNEHPRHTSEVQTRNDRENAAIRAKYPLQSYRRLAPLLYRLRMTKDAKELAQLQKAANITAEGFRALLPQIKPGMGEWEVEGILAGEFIRRASRGFAYPPIVASGPNACVLHYVTSHCPCEKGQVLLLDVGAEYGNYNADLTRAVPVSGRFTKRQRAVYDSVLRILRHCEKSLRPGTTLKAYTEEALLVLADELGKLGLAKAADLRKKEGKLAAARKYMPHGFSHHIGLDVHDVAIAGASVEAGHVYTIEPGIYLPDEGFGIRLENDYLIGRKKNTNLLADAPIEADEIENLMASKSAK